MRSSTIFPCSRSRSRSRSHSRCLFAEWCYVAPPSLSKLERLPKQEYFTNKNGKGLNSNSLWQDSANACWIGKQKHDIYLPLTVDENWPEIVPSDTTLLHFFVLSCFPSLVQFVPVFGGYLCCFQSTAWKHLPSWRLVRAFADEVVRGSVAVAFL